MFYKDTFVGNVFEMLDCDLKEAKTLRELESLIEKLSKTVRTFHEHSAPDELKVAYEKRLGEVVSYYRAMGGTVQ